MINRLERIYSWSMLIKDTVKRYRNIIYVFTFLFWFSHWCLLFHFLHVAPNPTPDATCLCNCVTCIYDWEILCWMEPEQNVHSWSVSTREITQRINKIAILKKNYFKMQEFLFEISLIRCMLSPNLIYERFEDSKW